MDEIGSHREWDLLRKDGLLGIDMIFLYPNTLSRSMINEPELRVSIEPNAQFTIRQFD